MEQLKMARYSAPVENVSLPTGYSLRQFDRSHHDRDMEIWAEICGSGLVGKRSAREAFDLFCTNYPDLVIDDISFILNPSSVPVATIVPVIHEKDGKKLGYIHMVGCRESERGKGLGNQLNRIALKRIEEAGCPVSYLTTDDFRLAAVKSYLTAGFLPVISEKNTEEMKIRWKAVLKNLNIASVSVLDENYSPAGILHCD